MQAFAREVLSGETAVPSRKSATCAGTALGCGPAPRSSWSQGSHGTTPCFILPLIEDITEGKMAEQRILEQASLIDLANDAIVVRDMENRIQFWSQSGRKSIVGWSSSEVVGRKVT